MNTKYNAIKHKLDDLWLHTVEYARTPDNNSDLGMRYMQTWHDRDDILALVKELIDEIENQKEENV